MICMDEVLTGFVKHTLLSTDLWREGNQRLNATHQECWELDQTAVHWRRREAGQRLPVPLLFFSKERLQPWHNSRTVRGSIPWQVVAECQNRAFEHDQGPHWSKCSRRFWGLQNKEGIKERFREYKTWYQRGCKEETMMNDNVWSKRVMDSRITPDMRETKKQAFRKETTG